MTAALVAVTVVATLNPARFPLGLPASLSRPRLELLALSAIGAALFVVGLLAVADPLLDGLDVSPESLRIAAGLVLAVGGARVVAVPRPPADAGLPGRGAALVPLLFPLLLTPELALVVLTAGADERNAAALVGLAFGVGLAGAGALTPRSPVGEVVLVALARLAGAVVVVAGVALVVDGIRDV